jgi:hypothetical protein
MTGKVEENCHKQSPDFPDLKKIEPNWGWMGA